MEHIYRTYFLVYFSYISMWPLDMSCLQRPCHRHWCDNSATNFKWSLEYLVICIPRIFWSATVCKSANFYLLLSAKIIPFSDHSLVAWCYIFRDQVYWLLKMYTTVNEPIFHFYHPPKSNPLVTTFWSLGVISITLYCLLNTFTNSALVISQRPQNNL